jgi:hypothetical protein
MTAFAPHAIPRGLRFALLAVVVAVAVAAMLLVWVRTGDTTSPPKSTSTTYTHPLDAHPLGPVTDADPNPWAANDCAVLLDVFGEDAHAYGC